MDARDTQPILIVEDSDDDFEATERALKRDGRLFNPIVRFDNGAEALDYLFHRGAYAGPEAAPLPGLMLLDLNMPGVDGRAVLTAVKSHRDTRAIPVVVLTTSDDDWDINECYNAGANTYIKKPVDLDGFFAALCNLKNYWLDLALLPRTS
ncbi:MAG: response regulator [Alphaproteobacteria bacterium]